MHAAARGAADQQGRARTISELRIWHCARAGTAEKVAGRGKLLTPRSVRGFSQLSLSCFEGNLFSARGLECAAVKPWSSRSMQRDHPPHLTNTALLAHHQVCYSSHAQACPRTMSDSETDDHDEYTGPPTQCRGITARGARCRIVSGTEYRGRVKMEYGERYCVPHTGIGADQDQDPQSLFVSGAVR